MQKRAIVFGEYNTAAAGWTLAGWQLSPAEQKTNFVERTGGDGSWDLSTALTDGQPRYYDRTLTVRLERSDHDRLYREVDVCYIVNQLSGMRKNITLPDDPDHYLTGRLHVAREYNDPVHAAVTVTAVCDPWKYKTKEETVRMVAASTQRTTELSNYGRRTVVPVLTVSGTSNNSLHLTFGGKSWALGAGTYQMPDILLTPGGRNALTYQGAGTLIVTYREAVLE